MKNNVVASSNNVLSKNDETSDSLSVGGSKGYVFFKRLFDIVSSGLLIIAIGWIILILMFIKFCEDGHNPIYVSTRLTKDGKPFKFHKIRSMVVNADAKKEELERKGLNEANGPVFKMKNDPRITPFGRFLRKTSLDELPQLWDILVGNLSVVGPRPPLPEEVKLYTPYQKHRLDVKGGLLCLWQISHDRNKLPFTEWINLDLKYIQTRSAWLDIKIIVKGFFFVLNDHSGE
jgi:lipopolysaccharide/colanic/teichoic acid biosynthesis glycosyltransferase